MTNSTSINDSQSTTMSTPSHATRPTAPDFDKGNGVITAVAQDAVTGAVLMVAQMDREAYDKTRETGEAHYRSRTRGLWHKGATSGNVQRVQSMHLDCDGDTLLLRVLPAGPACHTGDQTCFGPAWDVSDMLSTLAGVIASRMETREHPAADDTKPSYTHKLLQNRNLRLKKIGEECAELVVALADGDRERATEEGADVIYHTLVALAAAGVTLDDVRRVLANRTAGH
jgi:phosphoribosyl-ATP pyrophosphohydrolase/phosphoribosyl-AMP cyclohydrolase